MKSLDNASDDYMRKEAELKAKLEEDKKSEEKPSDPKKDDDNLETQSVDI